MYGAQLKLLPGKKIELILAADGSKVTRAVARHL